MAAKERIHTVRGAADVGADELMGQPQIQISKELDEGKGHGYGDGYLIGFHTRLKPKPWKSLTFEVANSVTP